MNLWITRLSRALLVTGAWWWAAAAIAPPARAQTDGNDAVRALADEVSVRDRVNDALEMQYREFFDALRERTEAQERRDRFAAFRLPEPAPPSLSDPAVWQAYPLGPGDQINIVLQPPFQELSTQATIAFDGTVFVGLLGQISLAGLTIAESAELLRSQFNVVLVEPEVQVILANPRPAQVTISGAVLRPGYFPIAPNSFVHQALLTAGGASVNADLRNIQVERRRADGTTLRQSIDLYTPIADGTPLPDVRLRDGDTIVVPERDLLFDSDYDRELLRRTPLVTAQDTPLEITILGEVFRPGYYDFASGIPPLLDQAIVTAQGAKSTADLRSVLVRRQLRDGSVIEREVDLYTPLIEGATVPDFPLESGDVVIVPELSIADLEEYEREIVALSTVSNPQITVRLFSRARGTAGPVTLQNGSRLADLLAQVPLQDSRLNRVALIRFDETQGEAVTEYYDGWDAIFGDENENVLLRDRDVVVVGRNTIASVSFALNRFTQPFRDILGFLLFFDQLSDSADNLFGPDGDNNNNNNRN
ncbi:MAG: SLBB domain-containing protein [Geitlerinemataceae cyanobacterium]